MVMVVSFVCVLIINVADELKHLRLSVIAIKMWYCHKGAKVTGEMKLLL